MTRVSSPPPWMTRQVVLQALARKRLRAQGRLPDAAPAQTEQEKWNKYQGDLLGFCSCILGMTPWHGVNGYPGQHEILAAIQDSVTRQLAGEDDVPFIFVVEAPHGVGKTYGIEAPVVAWFYRVFNPSVIITTAPTDFQVTRLLWKDIRTHVTAARGRGRDVMPGLLPKKNLAERSGDHFALGMTTSDAGGQGTERAQGQHNDMQLVVFDEAEGVPNFMFDGIKRQLTGNRVRIWLLLANPKTDNSEFQAMKLHPRALVFRLSLLGFPNVWDGTSEVPGGTSRGTFNDWIEDHKTFGCEVVPAMDETRHTFTLPWAVQKASGDGFHPPGTVFAPKRGFLYGALGVPPSGGMGDTLISGGRYDACLKRDVEGADPKVVNLGIDCGRYGDDAGTLYTDQARRLRFETAIQGAQEADAFSRTDRYVQEAVQALQRAAARGATRANIRVDGSGGYGGGIVDALRKREDLRTLFPQGCTVHEVQFGGKPRDESQYRDLVTEMYALADEVLSVTRIEVAGGALRRDLTDRRYGYVTVGDQDVRKLEQKKAFKKRHTGQSPDDGDGAVLALAPERLFVKAGEPSATATRAAFRGGIRRRSP
ncbi:hypothetical protein E7T09_04100 [Deinococcus sp. KSM4-11]|uniref:hypothetical protein n=1 Tax=Deinococcus sp. KSM4-11 TaxID=2568654 RepID=UPI0010A3B9BD|nr:hypothetical protein [Deinococcus sp. KSM4-11]THF88396.1 hypothetical protein E7T09_04100 [Deinococcus sp. KSM4-11]